MGAILGEEMTIWASRIWWDGQGRLRRASGWAEKTNPMAGRWRGVWLRPGAGHPCGGTFVSQERALAWRGSFAIFSFQPLWPAGPSLRMKIGAAQDTLRERRTSCEYEVFKQLSAKPLEHLAAKRNLRGPRILFTRQRTCGQRFERLAARRDWRGPRRCFEV